MPQRPLAIALSSVPPTTLDPSALAPATPAARVCRQVGEGRLFLRHAGP